MINKGWDTDAEILSRFKGIKKDFALYTRFEELKNYEKGFNLLMGYFDSIADEEKPIVDKKLKELGL